MLTNELPDRPIGPFPTLPDGNSGLGILCSLFRRAFRRAFRLRRPACTVRVDQNPTDMRTTDETTRKVETNAEGRPDVTCTSASVHPRLAARITSYTQDAAPSGACYRLDEPGL